MLTMTVRCHRSQWSLLVRYMSMSWVVAKSCIRCHPLHPRVLQQSRMVLSLLLERIDITLVRIPLILYCWINSHVPNLIISCIAGWWWRWYNCSSRSGYILRWISWYIPHLWNCYALTEIRIVYGLVLSHSHILVPTWISIHIQIVDDTVPNRFDLPRLSQWTNLWLISLELVALTFLDWWWWSVEIGFDTFILHLLEGESMSLFCLKVVVVGYLIGNTLVFIGSLRESKGIE